MKRLVIAVFAMVYLASCSKEKENIPVKYDYSFTEEVIDGIKYKCVKVDDQIWMAENLRTRLSGGRADGCLTYREPIVDAPSKNDLRDSLLSSLKKGVFSGDATVEMMCDYVINGVAVPQFFTSGGLYFWKSWTEFSEAFKAEPNNSWALSYFDLVEAEYLKLEKELKLEMIKQAADLNYANEYGYLYTYQATKSIAPSGWRVPTDEDWKKLEATLGMNNSDINLLDQWRGSIGKLMKENPDSPNFNARMAGAFVFGKYEFGDGYINKGTRTYWWSSSKIVEADTASLYVIRGLRFDNDQMLRGTSRGEAAYNVRLIKDNN